MGYLFKNCNILSMDKNREDIFSSDVLIEGPYIVKIGNNLKLSNHKVILCKNKLLMPGFINTHTHSAMTLLRGCCNESSLFDWLNNKILPFEKKLIKKDVYIGALLAIAEMLLSGTTTFLDMYIYSEELAKAVIETKIRGIISKGIVFENIKSKNKKNLNETKKLLKKYRNKYDLLDIFVAPHSVYSNNKEFLIQQFNIAKKYNTGIHIHISETEQEAIDSIKKYGMSPIEYLNSIGCLNQNNIIFAHCVYLTEKDCIILKDKNISISHNIKSNLKLASGIAPIYEYLKYNINISIGTDGAASNNNLDMLEELQWVLLSQNGFFKNTKLISPLSVLKMATINGAKALNLEERIGIIKEGYEADLILFDLNKPHYYPLQNSLIDHLVYSGKSSDIIMTMVKGKILMYRRKLLDINLKYIYKYISNLAILNK